MHSLLILLFSFFQQSDSNITYSMPVDKQGRIATLTLFPDSTFSFYARSFEIKSKSDWITLHTTVKGSYLVSGSGITFEFRGHEIQKYQFITHSVKRGYDWKKISDRRVFAVKPGNGIESLAFTFEGETYALSRPMIADSSLINMTGYFTTASPSDTNRSGTNETESVYSLYIAPCTFHTTYSPGHYFCLEFAYHDFEGGSMLRHVEGTYALRDGKLQLITVVNTEQNDAPLSGMNEKSIVFEQSIIDVEWIDAARKTLKLNSPYGRGYVFRLKE